MGRTMSDFPQIQLLAPKRGMPPRHFADLTPSEREERVAELGLHHGEVLRRQGTARHQVRRGGPVSLGAI
mgnify:CR=1 FL=1